MTESIAPKVAPEMVTLHNFKKLLQEDKALMSRHPILKHLYARYAAVVNDVTPFGYANTPIEPVKEFHHRVNDLLVENHNKGLIKKRKQRNRLDGKRAEKITKQRNARSF